MHDARSETVPQGDRFYTAGASMVMRQGGNLRIDAIVNSSCADVNYMWTLSDGSRLRPGEALGQSRILDNGTLIVARVNVSQSGDWYRVDVSNEGGNDSVVSTLRVICKLGKIGFKTFDSTLFLYRQSKDSSCIKSISSLLRRG